MVGGEVYPIPGVGGGVPRPGLDGGGGGGGVPRVPPSGLDGGGGGTQGIPPGQVWMVGEGGGLPGMPFAFTQEDFLDYTFF